MDAVWAASHHTKSMTQSSRITFRANYVDHDGFGGCTAAGMTLREAFAHAAIVRHQADIADAWAYPAARPTDPHLAACPGCQMQMLNCEC